MSTGATSGLKKHRRLNVTRDERKAGKDPSLRMQTPNCPVMTGPVSPPPRLSCSRDSRYCVTCDGKRMQRLDNRCLKTAKSAPSRLETNVSTQGSRLRCLLVPLHLWPGGAPHCCVLGQTAVGRPPGSLRACRKLQQRGRGLDGAAGWLPQKSCQAKKERPLPVQDRGSE